MTDSLPEELNRDSALDGIGDDSGTSPQLRARLKAQLAEQLERIEATATEQAENPACAKQTLTGLLRAFADSRSESATGWRPEAVLFDFDAEPETPDWIVHRLIERGTVVVLSGDTGSAKSIAASSLVAAVLADDAWLGHDTSAARILMVDEENPHRLVRDRLRSLGGDNSARDRLRYFNRQGVAIGDEAQSDAWLRAQLEDFAPDLLVIDTLMAACDVEDTNSNSDAVKMMKRLRALATEYGCGVLLLHHERKRTKDHPASSGQAMLGARQWAGQADAHMTLTVETDLVEEDAPTDGHRRLRRTFKWRPAEKDRDGRPNIPHRVAVESEKDERGRLLWMTVEDEGEIDSAENETAALAASIGAFVQREESNVTNRQIAAAVERDAQDGTFKRALKAAEASKHIVNIQRGMWGGGDVVVIDL